MQIEWTRANYKSFRTPLTPTSILVTCVWLVFNLNISLSVVRRDYQTPRPRTPGPLVRYELPPTGFVWLQRCLSHAMPSDNLLLTIFPSHLYWARRHLAELWIERKMLASLVSQAESLNESYEKKVSKREFKIIVTEKQWYYDKSAQHKSAQECQPHINHWPEGTHPSASVSMKTSYVASRLGDISIDHLFPDSSLSQIGQGTWALLICFERCDCPSYPAGLSHLPRHWGIEISAIYLLWLPSVKPSVRSKTLRAATFSESTPKFVFFPPLQSIALSLKTDLWKVKYFDLIWLTYMFMHNNCVSKKMCAFISLRPTTSCCQLSSLFQTHTRHSLQFLSITWKTWKTQSISAPVQYLINKDSLSGSLDWVLILWHSLVCIAHSLPFH